MEFIKTKNRNQKMKPSKSIIILLLLLFQVLTEATAQLCGGGILTFNIYTLNGSSIKEFEYEIFPVAKQSLENYFQTMREQKVDVDYRLMPNMRETGIIITENTASEIIDTKNDTLNNALIKLLERKRIGYGALPSKGKMKNSLQFQTLELGVFPVVLKITAKGKTVYIVGNYFGGCNRETSLIWDNKYTYGFRIF